MCASTASRSSTTSESSQWITSPVAMARPALRAFARPGVSQRMMRVPAGWISGSVSRGSLPLSTTITSSSSAG
jgi:hypothetical protein